MSWPGCWRLGLSRRQIAARLGRHPSTIGRELDRNKDPRTGAYQPERAHRLAWQRQRRPKPSKLSRNPVLRAEVQGLLTRRYSPEQASGRLRLLHPDDPAMRVSHETIYQSIYLYPRGGLKRELQACLRSGCGTRRRRGRREMRGTIIAAVPIGARPVEVQGRLVPGHHEGDLVMGSKASNSAVGTIVERSTGYLTLLHLPDGHTADAVAAAIITRMTQLPGWFARTLTWDRGTELARHARITAAAGISVYFADPHAPWQRGSNENFNGLLREYLPKGTDLSPSTAAQLQHIEAGARQRLASSASMRCIAGRITCLPSSLTSLQALQASLFCSGFSRRFPSATQLPSGWVRGAALARPGYFSTSCSQAACSPGSARAHPSLATP